MVDESKDAQRQVADAPSPGEVLRAARVEKKLDTKQIAKTLNVDPWMLDALEHDEYGALGAPVFAKGHLRKYATLLGLNADDLMAAYYQRAGTGEAPPLVPESIMRVPSAPSRSLNWLAPVAGVVVLVAAAAVVAFFYRPSDDGTPAERDVPAAQSTTDSDGGRSTTLQLPGARESDEGGDTRTAVDVPLPASEAPAPSSVEPSVDERPEPTGEPAASSAGTSTPVVELPGSDTAEATAVGSSAVEVTLRFRSESWVEVYDRDRTKLLYGLGEAGTERSLSGAAPLNVFLGKASAVDVRVNGRGYQIPDVSSRGTARFDVDAPPR